VEATLTADSRLNIDGLELANWPVEMKLTTSPVLLTSIPAK